MRDPKLVGAVIIMGVGVVSFVSLWLLAKYIEHKEVKKWWEENRDRNFDIEN